jgi:hypothetical protein
MLNVLNDTTAQIGALAFGLVVVKELVALARDVITFAKSRNRTDSTTVHWTEIRELRKQIADVDHRLTKLEGQLDA